MNIQTPHSKNTDPLSSHLAGQEITDSGKRQTQLEFVVGLVQGNEGKTRAELAKISGKDKYMIARRLSDALGVYVVQGLELRKCTVSNRLCVTWWMA